MEFRFQPDLFERVAFSVQAGPISIWIRCLAATNGKAGSARDRSITRHGFARRSVIPGLRGKCAHGRSPIADTPVIITCVITCVGRDSRFGVVPQGYMALASHSGSCERGCRDHCNRQKLKLGHSISPLDMKSQQRLAPPGNGAAIVLFKEHFLTSFHRRARSAHGLVSSHGDRVRLFTLWRLGYASAIARIENFKLLFN